MTPLFRRAAAGFGSSTMSRRGIPLSIALVLTSCLAVGHAQVPADRTLIVVNNAAFGGGPIAVYDFAVPGDPRFEFIPDGAAGVNNGRGLEVIGDEVFYTELTGGVGPTDFIRVAPLAGGPDIERCGRPLPNPRPDAGIAALSFHDGVLYALTGFPSDPLQVFGLDPGTGAVVSGPVAIQGLADSSSEGFTVLPDGHFLINSSEASCSFTQFDPITGAEIPGTTIRVPGPGGQSAVECSGVDTDGTFLYFLTNFNGFAKTDLRGAFVSQTSITGNTGVDISLIHAPSTPAGGASALVGPVTSAAASPVPDAAGWNTTPVTVTLSAAPSSCGASSAVAAITYVVNETPFVPPTRVAGATAVVTVDGEGPFSIRYWATDEAGNIGPEATQFLRIDKTPPTIQFDGNAGLYTTASTITIACHAFDVMSGVASDTCASATLNHVAASSLGVGTKTLTATATDVAGHSTSAATTFQIILAGFDFAALTAELEVDAARGRFEIEGRVALDPRSDGLDPQSERVSFSAGGMSVIIPKGSFQRTSSGAFAFEGVVDGRRMEASIVPGIDPRHFTFECEVAGSDPVPGQSRAAVQVSIGNDSGGALATVERKH